MNPMTLSDRCVAQLIALFRQLFGVPAFMAAERGLMQLSGFAAAAAAVMGLGLAVFAAIKVDSLSMLLLGLGWVLAVAVLHFIGARMLVSCSLTLRNSPSDVSSQDYLEVLGLLCIVVLVASLLGGLYMAIKLSALGPLWYGLGLATTMLFFACMYLNPSLINTRVQTSASAGQDAISVSVLTMKTFVRLAPVVFAVLTLAGALSLGYGVVQLAKEESVDVLVGGLASASGFGIVVLGLLYPLLAYLTFVLGYLLLDVARSILTLPTALRQGMGVAAPSADLPTAAEPVAAEAPASVEFDPAQARTLKVVGAVLAGVVVLALVGVQGKKVYTDFQERRALARMEQERIEAEKKAEEERQKAEKAQQEAEAARIGKIASVATAHKGRDALDLVVAPEISELVKAMLGNQQAAFERYFAASQPVDVQSPFVVATGCMADSCGLNEGILVVNTQTGTVHAAVYFQGQVRFLGGDSASTAPTPIRKWALKFQ